MKDWNRDLSSAPRGRYIVKRRKFGKSEGDTRVFEPAPVILATKCGKVVKSHYLPDEKRWEFLSKNEQPVAWTAWPVHPDLTPADLEQEGV